MNRLPYRSQQHVTLLVIAFAALFMLVLGGLALSREGQSPSLIEWARTAPLQSVTVVDGDTGWILIKGQLPEEARYADIGSLVWELERRTGEDLSDIAPPEAVLLPIPYEEWVASQQ